VPYYWIGGEPPTGLQEEGTDLEAISHGYVSVTPLHMDMTQHRLLDSIRRWLA
jgi:5'-nucleotidase